MPQRVNQNGFTLIELLVTMAIIVTLTSFFLVNYSGRNTPRNLGIARDNLVSDLRTAQSYALASRDITPGVTPSSDYGLVFSTASPTSYSFIGDDNATPANRSTLTARTFPSRIYISAINITRSDTTVTAATSLQILFTTPYSRVLQTYSGGVVSATKDPDATTVITISTYDDPTQTRTVTIDGVTGNIY